MFLDLLNHVNFLVNSSDDYHLNLCPKIILTT